MLAMIVWFFIALTMKSPRYLSTFVVKLSNITADDIDHVTAGLTAICGVAEAVVIPEDGAAYLKVELHALDKASLKEFSNMHSQQESKQ